MRQQDTTRDDQLNKGAHQFFLCLRPAVMENFGTTASGSPFKHLRVQSFDGGARILQPVTPSSGKDPAAGHYKKKSRRKFVRLIKAVLFETSLANKIKKRAKKKKQILNEEEIEKNDTYPVMETTTLDKKFGKKNQAKIITGTPSIETSSTLSSSSRASSIASSSMRFPDSEVTNNNNINNNITEPKQQKKNNEEKAGRGYYYGINMGLCLILVALVVLVIWGKLFAILCTSAWLIFVPNWRKGKNLLLLKVKSRVKSDQESMDNKEEYNKKVIMEGLLDRKRS